MHVPNFRNKCLSAAPDGGGEITTFWKGDVSDSTPP